MKILSLFDKSGLMVEPWAKDGYECICVDLKKIDSRVIHPNITYIVGDILKLKEYLIQIFDVKYVFGFPPCTDLAVSGARWFKSKEVIDPDYKSKAMSLVYIIEEIANTLGVPYMIENPISVISTEWRKPNYIFQPYDYTMYHKEDNYSKKTCLWTSVGFTMPDKNRDPLLPPPDTKFIFYLGSRRSEEGSITPRGFAHAVWEVNK